jgi:hypothetical protein
MTDRNGGDQNAGFISLSLALGFPILLFSHYGSGIPSL